MTRIETEAQCNSEMAYYQQAFLANSAIFISRTLQVNLRPKNIRACFLESSNRHTHLGGALPVRSKGGMGRVSVNTGREVAIVNIPL